MSRIQNVIIHTSTHTTSVPLTVKINEFHVELVKRRLNESALTIEQKIQVIDYIMQDLRSRESGNIIYINS